jgi:hypothetical protein
VTARPVETAFIIATRTLIPATPVPIETPPGMPRRGRQAPPRRAAATATTGREGLVHENGLLGAPAEWSRSEAEGGQTGHGTPRPRRGSQRAEDQESCDPAARADPSLPLTMEYWSLYTPPMHPAAARDERMVKTSFYLPEELLWAAKAMAASDRRSLRAWLTTLVETERRRRHTRHPRGPSTRRTA